MSVSPTVRKACHTPIASLIRGRLTGRLDWRRTIATSGLPNEIKQTILDVVEKTRLSRCEKVSVAEELIAHFCDGRDAGACYQELLRDFGDVEVVSQLIRISKIRNRSMIWKATKITAIGMLLCGLGIVAMLIYFFSGKATPSVNYLLDVTKTVREADDSDKAWPIYRDAWIKHGLSDTVAYDWSRNLSNPKTGELLWPGEPTWDEAIEFVDGKRDLMDAFRKGASLPMLGLELQSTRVQYSDIDQQALFPDWYQKTPQQKRQIVALSQSSVTSSSPAGSVVGVLMGHVKVIEQMVNLFHIDSRRAIQANDSQRWIENLETTIGLARQVSDTEFTVNWLASNSIRRGVMDRIEEVLSNDPEKLTDAQLAKLSQMIGKRDFIRPLKTTGLEASFLDLVQTIYTDDGDGDGRLTKQGLAILSGLGANAGHSLYQHLLASRKSTVDAFKQSLSLAEQEFVIPYYEQVKPINEMLRDNIENSPGDKGLIMQLHLSWPPLQDLYHQMLARRDATLVAIAIQQYKRITGDMPTSLADLVPEFIPEIPNDPVNGENIKYQIVNQQPQIYSVGLDQKDDGGKPLIDADGKPTEFTFNELEMGTTFKGDWILWPSR